MQTAETHKSTILHCSNDYHVTRDQSASVALNAVQDVKGIGSCALEQAPANHLGCGILDSIGQQRPALEVGVSDGLLKYSTDGFGHTHRARATSRANYGVEHVAVPAYSAASQAPGDSLRMAVECVPPDFCPLKRMLRLSDRLYRWITEEIELRERL